MKKSVLVLILAVILTLYPVRNFITLANTEGTETTVNNEAEEYLRELYDYDIKKAQSNVKKASNLRNDSGVATYVEINNVLKKLNEGKTTYRKIFKDVYIVGDSLMNGLECYNILNSNRLITQVSASLYHLSGNVKNGLIMRMFSYSVTGKNVSESPQKRMFISAVCAASSSV